MFECTYTPPHIIKYVLIKFQYNVFVFGPLRAINKLRNVILEIFDTPISVTPLCPILDDIQLNQNRILRMLSNKKVSDKISIATLLKENNMSSVNQTMAQIKISEMWKANHIENYPIKVETVNRSENSRVTRAITNNILKESAKSNVTIINDALKPGTSVQQTLKMQNPITLQKI